MNISKTATLLLLLIITITTVQANELYSAESLLIDTTITNTVRFTEVAGNARIDYLRINHTWVPQISYRQNIISFETEPEATKFEDNALFEVNEINDVDITLRFRTETTSEPLKVTDKITFPLDTLDPAFMKYLEATEFIDITPAIRMQAAQIIGDEDDLYAVIHKLSSWVNQNINYNLSTLAEEATKSSSWVLEERRGVCVELTNLFISFSRSLGIPARFVSGIAYTDSELFDFNWGGHGWAEVYIPGYGWMPVDPTYNQIGYVDATHIELEKSSEGSKYNTRYAWRGRGFSVEPGSLQLLNEIASQGEKRDFGFTASISFLNDHIDFGSYNVVIGTVSNQDNYYKSIPVSLADTQGLELLGAREKNVMLKPYENKEVYWIIRTSNDLQETHIYTFPVVIYNSRSLEERESFTSSSRGQIVSRSAAESILNGNDVSLEQNLKVSCVQAERTIYFEDEMVASCTIEATADIGMIELCFEDDCNDMIFNRGDSIEKELSYSPASAGFKMALVEARTPTGSLRVFLDYNILDSAKLALKDVVGFQEVAYGEQAALTFILERESKSLPVNVNVEVKHDFFSQEWFFDQVQGRQAFEFLIPSVNLKPGDNDLKIIVNYHDEKGAVYTVEEDAVISLTDVGLLQRVRLWLNYLMFW